MPPAAFGDPGPRFELAGVAQLDPEEPAGVGRIGVRQGRVSTQGLVDFGHGAVDRHVDVGGGLDRLDHAGGFLG